jgi:hypothetical protein
MRFLSLIAVAIMLIFNKIQTDSPHGSKFKISCSVCHSPNSWQLDKAIYSFDHNKTRLALTGQHAILNCRECHSSLVFSDAKPNCIDCHKDIHQASVGLDCSRCHTSSSWLVHNINDIHQTSRFPLLGMHRGADCEQCHKSESLLRFDVQGVNCIDCHRQTYLGTTNPNHVRAGFSEDCAPCHPITAVQWGGAGFDHSVFPLVQGHSGLKCADCHTSTPFTAISPACYSCHQQQYTSALNPNHVTGGFSKTCSDCHSLSPGWAPATFNHNNFPLTLGHANVTCDACHKGNYSTTSTDCYSCHLTDYNGSTNPNHKTLSFSTTCTLCHTTNPGWKPAAYTQHDTQFFPIYTGRHKGTWNLCTDCHTNAANYQLFDCIHCHQNAHRGSNYTNAQCYNCHPTGSGG